MSRLGRFLRRLRLKDTEPSLAMTKIHLNRCARISDCIDYILMRFMVETEGAKAMRPAGSRLRYHKSPAIGIL